jgi:hypothetical protein
MGAVSSSETSTLPRAKQSHIREDSILRCPHRENQKYYKPGTIVYETWNVRHIIQFYL